MTAQPVIRSEITWRKYESAIVVTKAMASEFLAFAMNGVALSDEAVDHIRKEFQLFKSKRKASAPVVLFSEFKLDYVLEHMDVSGPVEEMSILSSLAMRNPPNVAI